MTRFQKRLWAAIAVLALLSPLGLIVPEMLGSGDAWGEWAAETLRDLVGYVPRGLGRTSGLWNAPMQDYDMGAEGGLLRSVLYVVSALVGIGAAAGAAYLVARALRRGK
ncbi:MAG: hypothetical protein Kow0025_24690 [Thermodesulfovibrionales bacterium]